MDVLKNINYLNNNPNIKSLLVEAYENAEKGNVSVGFFKLRMFIESLEMELIKNNEWYKGRILLKDRPTSEEIIKRLRNESIITEDQANLFNSIRKLANKYIHLNNDSSRIIQDLETLKNFCIKFDNELPNFVLHLDNNSSMPFSSSSIQETKILARYEKRIYESNEHFGVSMYLCLQRKMPKKHIKVQGFNLPKNEVCFFYMYGYWEKDKDNEDIFICKRYELAMPKTIPAVKEFFNNDDFKGLEEIIEFVVNQFGVDTINILLNKPEKLDEFLNLKEKDKENILLIIEKYVKLGILKRE